MNVMLSWYRCSLRQVCFKSALNWFSIFLAVLFCSKNLITRLVDANPLSREQRWRLTNMQHVTLFCTLIHTHVLLRAWYVARNMLPNMGENWQRVRVHCEIIHHPVGTVTTAPLQLYYCDVVHWLCWIPFFSRSDNILSVEIFKSVFKSVTRK